MTWRRQLSQNATLAIDMVHADLIATCPRGLALREEHHVFGMTTLGVDLLRLAWESILSTVGVSIEISGVFCHQTPEAEFMYTGTKLRRELADLLIVHDHTIHGSIRRRALLIQTKMGPVVGTIGNPAQQYLYEHWPKFEISRAGGYLSGDRQLKPNNYGSSIGFISRTPVVSSSWSISKPWPGRAPVAINAGEFLTRMVLGKRGFGRGADFLPTIPPTLPVNRPSNKHWSITVEELLRISAMRAVTATHTRRFPHLGNIRGNIGNTSLRFLGDRQVPADDLPDEGGGIPFIHIGTSGEALN